MHVVYRGWMGGRVGKPKAGFPCHYGTDSGAVPSASDKYVHNPQDGSRQTLSAV